MTRFDNTSYRSGDVLTNWRYAWLDQTWSDAMTRAHYKSGHTAQGSTSHWWLHPRSRTTYRTPAYEMYYASFSEPARSPDR